MSILIRRIRKVNNLKRKTPRNYTYVFVYSSPCCISLTNQFIHSIWRPIFSMINKLKFVLDLVVSFLRMIASSAINILFWIFMLILWAIIMLIILLTMLNLRCTQVEHSPISYSFNRWIIIDTCVSPPGSLDIRQYEAGKQHWKDNRNIF